ncbi:MAG: DNA mismatch repair endonuclease MutL [Akkermansia sp.]|nr:DNA mismatch repair endonuclease MutL [Akkermansia sp.]
MEQNPEQMIHRMSDVLASQVAAGEVVERPASVVKELMENSIDAGADMIRVEIIRGGISLIKVTDNGCGMSRADALMCLERHATSKLLSFEDLSCIEKLGFRGEALPSISSVAELSITTRREQDVEGVVIRCRGGEMMPPAGAGCAPGTEICVSNLFFNTPVRRKFLKSNETEAGHIEHEIKLHALAYPQLRFVYVRDGQLVFDWPATSDLRQRIADFAGRELAAGLLRIKPVLGPGVHVSGYLMPLSEARRNRRMQYVFLNTRPVEDKVVARAIRDGYGGFPTGLHPALFLYLEVEPALVDVNVHPAKKEVRFLRPSDITTTIIDAISATLAEHARGGDDSLSPTQPLPTVAPAKVAPVLPKPGSKPEVVNEPSSFPITEPQNILPVLDPILELKPVLEPVQKELKLPEQQPVQEIKPHPFAEPQPTSALKPVMTDEVMAAATEPTTEPYSRANKFRYIGVCAGRYLLFENSEGLVLLSPRAARERILFERLLSSHERPLHSQRLLQSVMLDLDARDVGVALEVSSQLEKAGFRISHFGQRTLRVDGVPMMLSLPRVDEFLHELIRTFSSGEQRLKRNRNPFEPYALQLAKQYAAREDLRPWLQAPLPLLNELLNCEIPYCTPAGKPTMVPISLNELTRKFQAL